MKLDRKILQNSQQLRTNMTKEERHLWYDFLKSYPVQFKRQFPIGNYIVDFYCHKAKLVIELDGSQHFTPEGHTYDEARTAAIEIVGVEVLRFTNRDIDSEFRAVCTQIDTAVHERLNQEKEE